MALAGAEEEDYALTEGDFADEKTGATEVGEGIVEVDDVGCAMEARDEGFHGEVGGGFVVADVAACGEEVFDGDVAGFDWISEVAGGIVAGYHFGFHGIEDVDA